MDNRADASKRRSSRSTVLLSATIEFADRSQPVKLRNLSEDGALVDGVGEVTENSEILFRRNDLCVAGRVAWIQGDHAGIAFNEPLERQVVLRHVSRAAARPVPPQVFARPWLTRQHLSPEDQAWIDEWMATSPRDRPGD
jgi:hypothetical protein